MSYRRIIPCLDVKDGRVVKGVNFVGLRDAGDPMECAQRYSEGGADELAFLDITATTEGRRTLVDLVEKTARVIDVPLTVGGGIGSPDDVQRLLDAGASRVSINSAAVREPALIDGISARFGSDRLIVAIDTKSRDGRAEVVTHGGAKFTGIDALDWAREVASRGAGQILLTSMDKDGTRSGYDLPLTRSIAEVSALPIIASGGVGTLEHLLEGFTEGKADAVLAASVFHDGIFTINQVKSFLKEHGIPIRLMD